MAKRRKKASGVGISSLLPQEKPLRLTGPVQPTKDYTFYVRGMVPKAFRADARFPEPDHEVEVRSKDGGSVAGRGLVCSCYRGALTSITVRATGKPVKPEDEKRERTSVKSEFKPANDHPPGSLFSPADLCWLLKPLIFGAHTTINTGLVVITGETKSMKSLVARGLIHSYLMEHLDKKPRERRYHLVTCEKPIEREFIPQRDLSDGDEKAS